MSSAGVPRSSSQQIASSAVLPAADDHIAGRRMPNLREVADGNALHAVGDGERRRLARRHTRRHVGRVDHATPHRHVGDLAGEQGAEAPLAEVVAHREEPHPTRVDQLVPHDLVEVAADLGAAGALVEAGFAPLGFDAIEPEQRRVDAVRRRRLVQLHEGIRVEPVAPGAMPALDDDDVGIRVLDQAVDERRHPSRRHRRRDSRSRADPARARLDANAKTRWTR